MAAVKYRFLIIIIFIFISPFLHSQESASRIIKNDDGFYFIQTISYPVVADVFYYEIQIEKLTDGIWVFADKIETTETSIEVSLSAGQYRYMLTSFDKMNLIDGKSKWQEFFVMEALTPEVEGYRPYYSLFSDFKNSTATLIISGNNILPGAEFALIKNRSNSDWTGKTLDVNNIIDPISAEADGYQAYLIFDCMTLNSGLYEIFIRNPGGPWICFGNVYVGLWKKTDLIFSLGYLPMITAFDVNNDDMAQKLDVFNPLGFYFRFGWIIAKKRIANVGFTADINFIVDKALQSRMKNTEDSYSVFDGFSSALFNVILQIPVKDQAFHNFKLGMGFGNNYRDEGVGNYYYDIGYSFQFFLWSNLFMEAGLDANYVISPETNYRLNRFIFHPSLGFGLQMGRWPELTAASRYAKQGKDYSVPVSSPPKSEHVLSFGLLSMAPLYGIDLYAKRSIPNSAGSDYERGDQYLQYFNPVGFNFRYSYLSKRRNKNKIGFDFEINILDHINRNNVDVPVIDLFSGLLIGVRYQRILNDNWQLNVRTAIGLVQPYNYFEYENDDLLYYASGWNIGYGMVIGSSFQYISQKDAFIEIGIDLYLQNNFSGLGNFSIVIRPGIFMGWQLYRNNETGFAMQKRK